MNGINTTYIQGYSDSIIGLINNILVPILISIAFIVFLWGVYTYFIKGADDPKAQETGRWFALYGIIGFVVLFSVWGIVQIFMGTLNLTATNVPLFPTIGGGTGKPAAGNSYFPSSGTYGGSRTGGYYYSSSGGTPAQNQAFTVLQQTQSAYEDCAARYAGSSPQCQTALQAYEQAHSRYENLGGANVNPGATPAWCEACLEANRATGGGECDILAGQCIDSRGNRTSASQWDSDFGNLDFSTSNDPLPGSVGSACETKTDCFTNLDCDPVSYTCTAAMNDSGYDYYNDNYNTPPEYDYYNDNY
ncbi:MAG: pilin [Candidatus Paceibacterota bacterium]|jgi:hypothetical protein